MRKLIIGFILLTSLFITCLLTIVSIKDTDFFISIVEYYTKEHTVLETNEYSDIKYTGAFKITDNFIPQDKKDIIDIYYTVIDSGMDEFVFYCEDEYSDCINDVKEINRDTMLLSHMNSFVHVFNSYNKIKTEYKNNGKVTLTVTRVYDEENINLINNEVDRLFNLIYNGNKSYEENIKTIHDYIINNSRYDIEYINDNSNYKSNNAYGPLFEGHAICSGYTDLMALFLNKMNLKNHKVSTEEHIWNIVEINDKWLHLDITYDDPLTSNGEDYLRYDYMLINKEKLRSLDEDHLYDDNIYTH